MGLIVLENEKDVYDWLFAVEKSCGVSPTVGNTDICEETGEPYVEVLWANGNFMVETEGVIENVERQKTPERAWARWVEAFLLYQEPRSGKIHWRVRPEIGCVHADSWPDVPEHMIGYCVYSRLFVEEV